MSTVAPRIVPSATVTECLKLGSAGTSRAWWQSLPISVWTPDTDAPCGGPTARKLTNLDFNTLDFDASTDEVAYTNVLLPPWYDAGQLKLELFWTALSGSGDVKWIAYMKCLAHDAAITASGTNSQSVTSTLTAANDLQRTEFTITPNGAAANTMLHIIIQRDADAAGVDTLGADALVIGANLSQVQ